MRTCIKCNSEFKPNSRHRKCQKCRREELKTPCDCGRLKKRTALKCTMCAERSFDKNGNWKGGRTKHMKGYMLVKNPSHPQESSGYVLEHILVMEEHLGRYLFPEENVHHKNGVKDDNRLENLELWIRPQPPGIRVEDAIEWAKTILARYA